jgi:GT2 family glycosyltransferase
MCTKNKVSVVVVNWNGQAYLAQCIEALLCQTVKPTEIIVIDNASSDGSLDVLRQYPSVRLLPLNSNLGFARGNNMAVEVLASQTQWIALMNPDAFAMPDWLEKLLTAVERNPEFDVFGSKLVNAADPNKLDGLGDVYHMSGLVWRSGHGKQASAVMDVEREIFSPCAAAALYSRSIFEKVGSFDEDFFCYVEDIDLGFRMRLAGARCLYVPSSVVRHVGSGTTGGQHSDFSIYHGHRNLVWTFVKNMPGILFWLLLPLHMALNLLTIVWFAFRGQGTVIWRAKRDALLGLPKMWRKRQQIQKNRVATIASIWRMLDKRLHLLRR